MQIEIAKMMTYRLEAIIKEIRAAGSGSSGGAEIEGIVTGVRGGVMVGEAAYMLVWLGERLGVGGGIKVCVWDV